MRLRLKFIYGTDNNYLLLTVLCMISKINKAEKLTLNNIKILNKEVNKSDIYY